MALTGDLWRECSRSISDLSVSRTVSIMVGGVAWGDFQRHDLALMVDDEVQLEAIKPPHTGLAACCQAVEDLMTVDATVMTDGEFC